MLLEWLTLIKSLEQCESGLDCETKASDHVSSLTSCMMLTVAELVHNLCQG